MQSKFEKIHIVMEEMYTETDDGFTVVGKRIRQNKGSGKGRSIESSEKIIEVTSSLNEIPSDLKFVMYKKLFPYPKNVIIFEPEWREAWFQKFSEQFNFKIADDNLAAFLSKYESDIENSFMNFDKTTHQPERNWPFIYRVDELLYRATMVLSTFPNDGTMICALNIRLSNDGFLYPPNRQLRKLQENTVSNHKRSGWYLLTKDEVLKFPTAVNFAEKILGSSWKCMMYYHKDEQRMDLKFKHLNTFVFVQFEPGYPETYFDDNLWS